MKKDGKWANQLIMLQESDGKWGPFHSLSKSYHSVLTTEQALRRLERLGYTIQDECIQKAVKYMNKCLIGKESIPDRIEKSHNWSIFTSLMLATWIRRFTTENCAANKVAEKWATILNCAFISGKYNHDEYINSFQKVFGDRPKGGRFIDFVNFYQLSLINDSLGSSIEASVLAYVKDHHKGIYYVYDKQLSKLPESFKSKKASEFLAAIELLARFKCQNNEFSYVSQWLNENGKWDMGRDVNDGIYFPLSDNWHRKNTRVEDCTDRISKLLRVLN